jgi:hypothetical protein
VMTVRLSASGAKAVKALAAMTCDMRLMDMDSLGQTGTGNRVGKQQDAVNRV